LSSNSNSNSGGDAIYEALVISNYLNVVKAVFLEEDFTGLQKICCDNWLNLLLEEAIEVSSL
jgi:hypothetical protein